MHVITAATTTNTTGSTTQRGGPDVSSPKKMSVPPATPTFTSRTRTSTMRAVSSAGANGNSDRVLRLVHRNPRPMPRKLPSRTTLEKYARYSTFAPSQRISASSMKSMRNAVRTSCARKARPEDWAARTRATD